MRPGFSWLCAVWLSGIGMGIARGEDWTGGGIGVIGDSYSDEYEFYPPERSAARNWVEILAATRGLDFGPFSVEDRGEPRKAGYAYNWARSWATTDSMLADGQHTGLAEQVARGDVGLVCIFIGGNDFIEALHGPDPLAALPAAARRAARNLEVAVGTILAASPEVKLLLATVPDVLDLPEFAEPLASGSLPTSWGVAASKAIQRYNAAIRAMSGREGRVAVADLYLSTQLARFLSPSHVVVGGRRIARDACGSSIEHAFLADRRHVGTVIQGLLARVLVVSMNRAFGTGIRPPSDREILDFATRIAAEAPSLADDPPRTVAPTPRVAVSDALGR